MSISNQAKLLELLNSAMTTNNAAMLRSGLGDSVSKLNMRETKAHLQNAIRLLEEGGNDEDK